MRATRLLLTAALAATGCYVHYDHDDCWNAATVVRIVDAGEISCLAIFPGYNAEAWMIDSDADWVAFWEAHAGCWPAPVPPPPPADLARETIVAVVAGDRTTTGYQVVIDGVWRCDDILEIRATERVPGPGCAVTPGTTRPYQILAVQGHYDTLWFSRYRFETYGCP